MSSVTIFITSTEDGAIVDLEWDPPISKLDDEEHAPVSHELAAIALAAIKRYEALQEEEDD